MNLSASGDPTSLRIYTPTTARFLDIMVHSYSHAIVTCYLNDFVFADLTGVKVSLLGRLAALVQASSCPD
ncbi:MAG: hypothetical protein ACUVX8_09130 [Candidatus Zipacnadales bacterium]